MEGILIIIVIAYLIGSIPFGLILGKLAGIGDIRKTGSGNIGATNMLRAGGKKLALLTLLLDAGKGVAAVQLGEPALCALFVVIGHCYPVWLKFKGGKGVATAFGALLAISLPEVRELLFDANGNLGALVGGTWLLIFLATGYSSLAAIVAGVALIASLLLAGVATIYWPVIALDLLVLYRHKENIRRLLKGEEKKFNLSSKKKSDGDKKRGQETAPALSREQSEPSIAEVRRPEQGH